MYKSYISCLLSLLLHFGLVANCDYQTIPFLIGAEDYCDEVGIDTNTFSSGGQYLHNIEHNDWVSYNINVPATNIYTLRFSYAKNSPTGSMTITQDGQAGASFVLNPTGSWENYQIVEQTIPLVAGSSTLKFTFTNPTAPTNGILNLDFFQIYANCEPVGTACDDGNIATNNDVEDGNCVCSGTPCSPTQIPALIESAMYCNGFGTVLIDGASAHIEHGDWHAYQINIPQTKTYNFIYKYAKNSSGGSMNLYQDGSFITTINIPPTNSWNDFNIHTQKITLSASSSSSLRMDFEYPEAPENGILSLDYISIQELDCDDISIPTTTAVQAETYCDKVGIQIVNNGTSVGYTNHNNWVSYNISVPASQEYSFNYHYSKLSADGALKIYQDNVLVADINSPATGSWTTYDNHSVPINLQASASSELRVVFDNATSPQAGVMNLDYFTINTIDPCENFSYFGSHSINNGNLVNSTSVDCQIGDLVRLVPSINASWEWINPAGSSVILNELSFTISNANQFGTYTASYTNEDNCEASLTYTLNSSCPLPGTACDDGNSNTENDVEDGSCNCAGTLMAYRISMNTAVRGYKHIYLDCFDCKMHKDLNDLNLIPNAQPFNIEPFYYNGNESINPVPDTMVDWILVVARDGAGNALDRIAAIMHQDASVTNINGSSELIFENLPITGQYYISVHHKGHLGIISDQLIDGNAFVDFTDENNIEGDNQAQVLDGDAYMHSGDYNNNGVINSEDFNEWSSSGGEVNVYKPYDADGNGIINNLDYNAWANNRSKLGAEPIIDADY